MLALLSQALLTIAVLSYGIYSIYLIYSKKALTPAQTGKLQHNPISLQTRAERKTSACVFLCRILKRFADTFRQILQFADLHKSFLQRQ